MFAPRRTCARDMLFAAARGLPFRKMRRHDALRFTTIVCHDAMRCPCYYAWLPDATMIYACLSPLCCWWYTLCFCARYFSRRCCLLMLMFCWYFAMPLAFHAVARSAMSAYVAAYALHRLMPPRRLLCSCSLRLIRLDIFATRYRCHVVPCFVLWREAWCRARPAFIVYAARYADAFAYAMIFVDVTILWAAPRAALFCCRCLHITLHICWVPAMRLMLMPRRRALFFRRSFDAATYAVDVDAFYAERAMLRCFARVFPPDMPPWLPFDAVAARLIQSGALAMRSAMMLRVPPIILPTRRLLHVDILSAMLIFRYARLAPCFAFFDCCLLSLPLLPMICCHDMPLRYFIFFPYVLLTRHARYRLFMFHCLRACLFLRHFTRACRWCYLMLAFMSPLFSFSLFRCHAPYFTVFHWYERHIFPAIYAIRDCFLLCRCYVYYLMLPDARLICHTDYFRGATICLMPMLRFTMPWCLPILMRACRRHATRYGAAMPAHVRAIRDVCW